MRGLRTERRTQRRTDRRTRCRTHRLRRIQPRPQALPTGMALDPLTSDPDMPPSLFPPQLSPRLYVLSPRDFTKMRPHGIISLWGTAQLQVIRRESTTHRLRYNYNVGMLVAWVTWVSRGTPRRRDRMKGSMVSRSRRLRLSSVMRTACCSMTRIIRLARRGIFCWA